MKIQKFYLFMVITVIFFSCKKETDLEETLDNKLENVLAEVANGKGITHFIMPESDDFASIPQDPKNPLTQEKVALGKLLYHETGLALAPMRSIGKGTYSCASCHFASAGFQAGRHQGISEGGRGFGNNGEGRDIIAAYPEAELDVQPVRTPSAMNGAYQELMLWNGQFGATGANTETYEQWDVGSPKETNELGFQGLETQAIAGMKVHRLSVTNEFIESTGYKELFDQAFPEVSEEQRYGREQAGLAIAAYERTLLANKAPFQEWLRGNASAMTNAEKRGAILFFEKGQCGSCHTGPVLNTMAFHAYGMNDLHECSEPTFKSPFGDPSSLGRGGFTKEEDDMYKFKVPQLYNLADSPFYGHGSSMRSIREVVAYKNAGIAENPSVPEEQLADAFQPLGLTESEINDITTFLETALRDPSLERYVPNTVLSGQCFPNNDDISKRDLGCN